MFIEEIVIDGFKSYAHRTVIKGFDPHFNAITGLNGSGKSNILDSICFVLGITNLSQVRAGNLSELVYKQGQAGVNKAVVTIVFNNEDEASSPVGYEHCKEVTVTRQVLLGGKSKYLVNGKNTPASHVQNLFHTVQLNVNNPHFLIMQGRITKVLNMKPHEILGMIEEAAGTRMYENKRVAALKTIDKKQAKVDELNSVLSEEITPTLEKLRGEKQNYLKWSKNNADIERIQRFVVANDFTNAKNALENNSEGTDDVTKEITELEERRDELKEEIEGIDEEAKKLQSTLKGEMEEGYSDAKADEDKCSKRLVKITSTWTNSQESVTKAEKDLDGAKGAVEEIKTSITAKEGECKTKSARIDQQKQDAEDAEKHLAQLSSDYQNMSAGISSSQGDEGRTLPERISKAHSDSKTAEAKAKQARMKINHLTKELKSVEAEMNKQKKTAGKLADDRQKIKSKVDGIAKQRDDLNFSAAEFNAMEQEKNELEASLSELAGEMETISSKLEGRLSFRYADPVRGFDRSKVKGVVAKLITVHDRVHTTAIEIAGGSKIRNIVVDEAVTSRALLNKGKLEKRVTLIPLDKIRGRRHTQSSLNQARSVASSMNTTVYPAIELVGFDEEIRAAMEFVFGGQFVVDGPRAANKICDDTKTRSITLEGDVYDPSGTISGGSKNPGTSILEGLGELADVTQKHNEKETTYKSLVAKINALKGKSIEFENLSTALELAQTELAGIEKHLSQTTYGILVERKETMEKELQQSRDESEEMIKEQEDKWNLYNELKNKEIELTQEREVRLKDLEAAVKAAKEDAAKKTKIAREAKSTSQTLTMELDSLKAELLAAQEAVRSAEKALNDASTKEGDLQIEVGEVKAQYDEAKGRLDEAEKRRATCSTELKNLDKERSKKSNEISAAAVEIKKKQVAIAKIEKERATAERVVANMLKKHPWIESEQTAFGVAGGDYDFEAMDTKENSRMLQSLKAEQDSLSKKINKKVMGMIEKAEGEYTELLRKRKVIENDKKKIQAVIEELDVKKKTELQRTWKKVNRDFGSIFSTLLPGTSAKLEPPEGMEAWEGLEVKVAFGDVWKESLSELSGGQRSLLALSLILSLLLFKPAPMYILDEVDAALDLSHTQNIGNMLKTHFSLSQFIVVSLKEGMFNNANVIFRTKFVDGVSTVSRTLGVGSSRPNVANSNNDGQGKKKAANRRSRAKTGTGKENV
ncbi:Mitotic chromosome and X-chromosome-associated protein mix-1 [Seminavis robusta]|uniref:Structural maintenance of chromosomes protein n=1 Tax=Seminavis robusta TaxID=568900 RepID=A0A9N8E9Z9_9STRA|nr:Mitotic chromosome and X-chromosome-associated protein mix-1 [Seminavis robusta]|eukprot:Sro864_g212600.1 Mitotic chromosome and X-chromosome-associated protein mix-1 (1212) ;mRNA; f:11900-15806